MSSLMRGPVFFCGAAAYGLRAMNFSPLVATRYYCQLVPTRISMDYFLTIMEIPARAGGI